MGCRVDTETLSMVGLRRRSGRARQRSDRVLPRRNRLEEDRADRMLGLVEAGVVVAAVTGGGNAVPVVAPTCRIEGPRRVRGEVDARGRVSLRPLLVRCATRARVVVRVRSANRHLGRLRGVRFSVPARSASRIRLGGRASSASASHRSVLGRRAVVRVSALAVRRRFEVTLRRPSPGKPLLGVGDQAASMFADRLFAPLQVQIARLVVPWDAMRSREVDRWLGAARRSGVEPLVAFGHGRGDRCPDAPCRLPSVSTYTARFRAFRRRFPWVRVITPWNEPNQPASRPRSPGRAARYYNAVRIACGPARSSQATCSTRRTCAASWRYRARSPRHPRSGGCTTTSTRTYGGPPGLEDAAQTRRGRGLAHRDRWHRDEPPRRAAASASRTTRTVRPRACAARSRWPTPGLAGSLASTSISGGRARHLRRGAARAGRHATPWLSRLAASAAAARGGAAGQRARGGAGPPLMDEPGTARTHERVSGG